MASRRAQLRKLRKAAGRMDSRAGRRGMRQALRYASGKIGRSLRRQLRSMFGAALGDLLAEMADIFAGGGRVTEQDINDAKELLEASGYRVSAKPPGPEADPVPPPIAPKHSPQFPPEPPDGPAPGPTPPSSEPPRGSTGQKPVPNLRDIIQQDDDYPEEHTIDTRKLSAVLDPGEGIWANEIETPESSNVYSIAYDEDQKILYVTFKAMGRVDRTTGKRPHRRGATYFYGGRLRGIPAHIWSEFKAAASKGGFVWDYLRVRGTIHGHHYPYGLVSGDMSSGTMYVPRKATRRGLRSRSVVAAAPTVGQPRSASGRAGRVSARRRTVERSTLPDRLR